MFSPSQILLLSGYCGYFSAIAQRHAPQNLSANLKWFEKITKFIIGRNKKDYNYLTECQRNESLRLKSTKAFSPFIYSSFPKE